MESVWDSSFGVRRTKRSASKFTIASLASQPLAVRMNSLTGKMELAECWSSLNADAEKSKAKVKGNTINRNIDTSSLDDLRQASRWGDQQSFECLVRPVSGTYCRSDVYDAILTKVVLANAITMPVWEPRLLAACGAPKPRSRALRRYPFFWA